MRHASARTRTNENDSKSNRYRVVGNVPQGVPAAVGRMISHFDGKRSLEEVCAQTQMSVAKGAVIVKKLTRLGVLALVARPTATAMSGSAFTAAEEAFFASEVEPIDLCDEPFETVGEKLGQAFSGLILRVTGSPAF